MTAHKYCSIVAQWQLNELHVSGMLVGSWLTPFVIILVLTLSDTYGTLFGLQASNNYCIIAFNRTELVNVVASSLVLAFIFGTILMLMSAHVHIFIKYRKWKQSVKMKRGAQTSDQIDDEEVVRKEAILIKKSVVISGIFSCSWMFYVFLITYEMSTHQKVPREYDVFWEWLAMTIPILNLIALFIYDAKFKRNINDLIKPTFNYLFKRFYTSKSSQLVAIKKPEILTPVVMLTKERNDKSTVKMDTFKLGKTNG